jgi:hypothetical protein
MFAAVPPPPTFPVRTVTVAGIPGRLGGPVGPIALDGRYAAYAIVRDSIPGCPFGVRVYRLDLQTGRSVQASGGATCSQEQTSTGRGVFQLAVSGTRTSWLANEGGNTESDDILFSSTAPGKDKIVARSHRTGPDPDTLTGSWLGGLVSDGTRITYKAWTSADPAVLDASADAGRVAVLRGDGSVTVLGIDGRTLQTLQPGAAARAVALDGGLVAVLVKGSGVDVYDRTTAALLHTWPVASGASTLDAHNGVASYIAGGTVHVLNLLTGRDATVLTGKRIQVTGARIDAAGLLYAFDTRSQGKIVFVPFAAVAKTVGR